LVSGEQSGGNGAEVLAVRNLILAIACGILGDIDENYGFG
jgi:hypothetical protein